MNALTPITAEPLLPLSLPETRTFAEWSAQGSGLLAAKRIVNWLIGDWLIAGLERYDEKARDEANRLAHADIERFGPIIETCRRFPLARRHDGLSFEHHKLLLHVDDAEAERLLSEAESNRMTAAMLKAQVRTVVPRLPILEDDDPEDAAMRLIAQAWNRAPIEARRSFLESANEAKLGEIEL